MACRHRLSSVGIGGEADGHAVDLARFDVLPRRDGQAPAGAGDRDPGRDRARGLEGAIDHLEDAPGHADEGLLGGHSRAGSELGDECRVGVDDLPAAPVQERDRLLRDRLLRGAVRPWVSAGPGWAPIARTALAGTAVAGTAVAGADRAAVAGTAVAGTDRAAVVGTAGARVPVYSR